VDAYGPGNSRSSSGDESRIMRLGYGADEIYTQSALRSLQRWKEFCAEQGVQLFHQTGVLWLAHEDDRYSLQTWETLTRLRILCERLTTAEVAQRYPQIGLAKISWAMLETGSGVLMARRSVQAVVRAAIKRGVALVQDAVDTCGPGVSSGWDAKTASGHLNQITTTGGRRISAAVYVFACGPWLPKMFPQLLGHRINPTRQEVFYLGPPPADPRFTSAVLPTWIDFQDEAYGLPDVEGRGVKVAIDRHGEPFDPDTGDRVVTSQGLAEVRRYLAARVPALRDAPVIESRVCQYENSSNGDFLIDRHPGFENVWLVGGGSGHGFKHGPMVGEYVAARVNDHDTGIETRFSLATKGEKPSRTVY